MIKILSVSLLPAAAFACSSVMSCSQATRKPINFVIDSNREFVYLKFDHLGKGIKRREEEPELRIWLKLVNNCNVPIQVNTYSLPDGSPREEIGLMDEVVKDTPPRIMIIDTPPPPPVYLNILGSDYPSAQPEPAAGSHVQNEPQEPPADYWFELGSLMIIQPNHEILFSIPVDQLGWNWHIQIPFEFEVPKGKVPRAPEVGGSPEMYISYSLYDLPDDVRSKIGSPKSR